MYSACISLGLYPCISDTYLSLVWCLDTYIDIRERYVFNVFQNAYPALPHVSYMCMYMYPACIPHIFCMYLACILIVS